MRSYLIAALLILAPSMAAAQSIQHFVDRQPVTLRTDTALVLFRADGVARAQHHGLAYGGDFDFVLVRGAEIAPAGGAAQIGQADHPGSAAALDPNVYRTDARKAYDRTGEDRTYLVGLPPGRYVIAAATPSGIGPMGTCFCMGTLAFEAKGGEITDLGYLLATWEDRPTKVAELAAVVAPGKPYIVMPPLIAATVRQSSELTPIPEALRSLPRAAAEYRAVGKFPNYFHSVINRMAPVDKVLAYEGDKVIDLKSR